MVGMVQSCWLRLQTPVISTDSLIDSIVCCKFKPLVSQNLKHVNDVNVPTWHGCFPWRATRSSIQQVKLNDTAELASDFLVSAETMAEDFFFAGACGEIQVEFPKRHGFGEELPLWSCHCGVGHGLPWFAERDK